MKPHLVVLDFGQKSMKVGNEELILKTERENGVGLGLERYQSSNGISFCNNQQQHSI